MNKTNDASPAGRDLERAATAPPRRHTRDTFAGGTKDRRLRIAVDSDQAPLGRLHGKLRIAVDFDGVLFDHIPYVLRGFRDHHDIDLEAEGLEHWDFFDYEAVRERGLTWRCVRNVLSAVETDPDLHENPLKDPYARHVLAHWQMLGHKVDIVTARLEESRDVTETFLARNHLPYDALRMEASPKLGYDVLIDDGPHNVLLAAAAGSATILLDHPYNRQVPCGRNPYRARTWRGVAAIVDEVRRDVKAPEPPEAPGISVGKGPQVVLPW